MTFTLAGCTGKTNIWDVSASNLLLGQVKWLGSWGRYMFLAGPEMLLQPTQHYLSDITRFCDEQTRLRREAKRAIAQNPVLRNVI